MAEEVCSVGSTERVSNGVEWLVRLGESQLILACHDLTVALQSPDEPVMDSVLMPWLPVWEVEIMILTHKLEPAALRGCCLPTPQA